MIKITDINSSGHGVGRQDGMAVFVPFTVIGDEIEVEIISKEKNYAIGKIHKIITPGESRVNPPCPHYFKCGGCNLLHMEYNAQLTCKENIVKSALKRIGKVEVDIPPIVPSKNVLKYRNKASFPVSNGKIGYYEENSHNIVEIDSCPLLKDEINNVLVAIKPFIAKHGENISHVVVRTTQNGTSVTFVQNEEAFPFLNELLVLLSKIDICGIHVNVNTNLKEILGKKTITVYKEIFSKYEIMKNSFKVSPTAFLQVNDSTANAMYTHAINSVDLKGKVVLDAYCGIGTISLALAKTAREVIGIEINKNAISDGKISAKENGINNVSFYSGLCENLIPKIFANSTVSTIFIDPPRSGIGKDIIRVMDNPKIKDIVYISCNPSTMARDVSKLGEQGFSISSITAFDMFPNTPHVECVVLMSRKKS